MKQIKVLASGQVHVSTTGTNVTAAMDLSREARRNKAKVIEGALTVENELVTIISHYFFGTAHERKPTFQSLVLDSDWCSFAAKRKLINHIINELRLLEGNEKADFDKLLSEVMSLRNAFTHGTLSSDGERVWLSFFQGTPRKHELTDDFLTQVENTLRDAYEQSFALAQKIGAVKHLGTRELA